MNNNDRNCIRTYHAPDHRWSIHNGKVETVLPTLGNSLYDGAIFDPPYALKFMGNDWDKVLPSTEVFKQILRACKPGAHLLAFGHPKTFHRLMLRIEEAGWEIRDTLSWINGEGFPKSHNIGKAITKRMPTSEQSKAWEGFGTALKPAWEPIILAQKPREKSFADNALRHGCGGLDIDGCRVGTTGGTTRSHQAAYPRLPDDTEDRSNWGRSGHSVEPINKGRWPANLLLDEVAAEMLDQQSGFSRSRKGTHRPTASNVGNGRTMNPFKTRVECIEGYDDMGGASRFFYVAKAKKEREGNEHPTVKPTDLCRYLAQLILPPERKTPRRLLVPYSGSGSEMVGGLNAGWDRVEGIEMEERWVKTAQRRLKSMEVQVPNSSESGNRERRPAISITEALQPAPKVNSVEVGNCCELISRLPDESVNLAVTSPPYADQRKRMYPGIPEKEYPDFTVEWMGKLWSKLADDGSVMIVIRPHLKKGVISDYVLRTRLALRDYGWKECEELIWFKPDGGNATGSNRRPRRSFEHILWFSKTHDPYIDTKACGKWSDRIGFEGKNRFGMGPNKPHHKGHLTELKSGNSRSADVIDVPVAKVTRGVMHPAMFPIPLAEHLIKTFSPEGGTVLDPFAGSGSTLLAAKQLGCQFYGFDIMPQFVELARKRLNDSNDGPNLAA
ncbi:site-specific DNA-methyltransferase [Rhodopirellula bahusiensis]|uniref:site-specific DNA-methyltransferase (cytosine-N(4)-specific) n=1 Tax=Rhodopirellula bahusiensis TaxID=2014065 RepID=A0A2G1W809_9BACT|nr:hypothetical protein CEE69_12895 [Rhodopirellula bahusiensis]